MLGILGDLVEDVIVWLAEPLRHGTDTQVEIFHTRGGSAANVASFAGRLGPTRFIGCVGNDHLGDRLVLDLEAEGVEVRVQRKSVTGTIVILIDQTGERRCSMTFPTSGSTGSSSSMCRRIPLPEAR